MVYLAKRRFEVVNSQQVLLLVIPPIFLAAATVLVVLRWRARHMKRVNSLVEDLLCLCALVTSVIVVALICGLVILEGQGLHTQQVEEKFGQHLSIRNWLRGQFAIDICWATSVTAVYLSLCVFYARLYETRRSFYYLCYLLGGLKAIWWLYAITVWAYYCHPPGGCTLASKKNCIAIGSMHVTFLVLGIGSVLPSITGLDMTTIRRKLAVLGLFALGSFCIICAVLRMDCLFSLFADYQTDPVGASWGRIFFSPLEIAGGIIACSIPTLTSFHEPWRNERRQLNKESAMMGLRRLKFRSGSSSSSTSNLNPANWVGKNTGHHDVFVSLADDARSSERVRPDGGDDIKVIKEYTVVHKT
ncbi:hypothetical protein BU23DRAFT_562109 [Bimuria novae-zelandiae CBS 107.79]|uniref:Rhodopsin domain-containing protein n=1 Tax=Bimuria novae-zelandiae CBS 107.79 TaxID=1447943 RepID=A0A6A5UHY2_9PLEO|nr:hypothetical protein BU23DRAFT_562109 [Bimuria novae-zelandiae CBS 107.79]